MKKLGKLSLISMLLLPAASIAGEDIQTRIVGGYDADPANWKFYTQLVKPTGNRSYCGASYIGDGFVLTAAHCVAKSEPSGVAVKVGGYKFKGTDGVRANVTEIHVHPSYYKKTASHDIALLKLDRVLTNAAVVDIAAGSLDQYVRIGDTLTVAGLGRLTEGGSSPTVLQAVDVPLVTDATCQEAGGNYKTVGDVSFCAGVPEGKIDACQGDSGGPIVVNQGGQVTQLGIVSWGIGCARAGQYGVYTDIAAFTPWIERVMTGQLGNVSVGHVEKEIVSSFALGEVKTHDFTIKNTGDTAFNFNRFEALPYGVANNLVTASDDCSTATLEPEQSCKLSVEFGGSKLGTATVNLSFNTDQNRTEYTSIVSALVTTDVIAGCSDLWDAGTAYTNGATVLWVGQIFEAKWGTTGVDPSTVDQWGAWKSIGVASCNVVTPTPIITPTPPINNYDWDASAKYPAGSKVIYQGTTYIAAFWNKGKKPGVHAVWKDANLPKNSWNVSAKYPTGSKVIYQGVKYTAAYWNKGKKPGVHSVWKEEGLPKNSWSASAKYPKGSKVVYKGVTYVALFWNKGKKPGITGQYAVWTEA